ncbi:MAG: nucleotidyl transferase AbiEii/AbiGii toxin family protein [Lentisphaerota bacterium]
MALELVGRLAKAEFPFVFKGGTSLLLHVQPIRRLSIDADIATPESLEGTQAVLNDVVSHRAPFTRWQHQAGRDSENPPTRYFQVYYPSAIQGKEQHIQLDVLIEAASYPVTEKRIPRLDFLRLEEEIPIAVPCINGLLGDKLAAFAPSTIGIPYQPKARRTGEPGEPRPIRVCKQLFDVGVLFELATDLSVIDSRYRIVLNDQNRYRNTAYSFDQALNDTLDAAFWIAQTGRKITESNDKTVFFQKGFRSLKNHLLGSQLTPAEQALLSARAALLAALLLAGQAKDSLPTLRTIPSIDQLRSVRIDGPWARLDSLRKISPEAFHYWHQTALMMGK